MKDASGVYTFTYDPLNRVETVTNPADKTIQYTYDPVGNRAAMLDPDGGRFTYSYDAAGRVASIVDDDTTHLTDYSSLGQGTVVIADRPQPEVKFTLVDLNENNHPETGDIYSGLDRFGGVKDNRWHNYDQNEDVDRIQHGYDCAGNRLWRENVVAAQQNKDFDELYLYDGLHRLVDIQRGRLNAQKDGIQSGTLAFAQTWQLDETGNWPNFKEDEDGSQSWDLDQGRTHNPVNEITAITAATGTDWADPAHDRNGNMTTIPKPANLADGLTASYDAWNRLVEVKDGEAVIARYEYDGLNRRIKSHLDSGAPSNPSGIDTYLHYYYNSTWQILETRQSDTQSAQPETLQPKHQYVWSQRYIDAPVLRDENTGTNGLCDDQRLYYLNDANFNVTALLDTVGDAVERYLYSPYGVATIYDATWTNTRSESSYANVTLYTGRELDPETGLYYYRNRYYSAELGRFLSRDPLGYADAFNLYRYNGNQPTRATDPAGLGTFSPELKSGTHFYSAVELGSSWIPPSYFYHVASATPYEEFLTLNSYVFSKYWALLYVQWGHAQVHVSIAITCNDEGKIGFSATGNTSQQESISRTLVAWQDTIDGRTLTLSVVASGSSRATGGPNVSLKGGPAGISVQWPNAAYENTFSMGTFVWECVCE